MNKVITGAGWVSVFLGLVIGLYCETAFSGAPANSGSIRQCLNMQTRHIMTIPGSSSCPPGYIGKKRFRNTVTGLPHKEAAKKVSPAVEGESVYRFTHTLEGDWDDVVGYVGFQFNFLNDTKKYIACLIGLPVESIGDNEYQSEAWDKKLFWLDVGDGSIMPVCAIYAPNYEEDGEVYDNVYWAPNFQYLPPGVQDKSLERPCELWMYLDEEDEIDEVWVDIYDENWEYTRSKELSVGDQLRAYTPILDPSEPDSFYVVWLEDGFKTVTAEPIFLYEHLTPNVDFVNERTSYIDYDNVDLLFILYGSSWDEENVYDFAYSTPKDIGLKWSNKITKIENWFLHEISGILNFFAPSK